MLNRIFPRPHRFQCPDEHQLAAYVDQQLIGGERERVESHLAKCDSCLQQVGFLIKQADTLDTAPVPAWLLRRAERLESPPTRGNAPFAWKWASVAAAIVIVTGGVAAWHKAQRNTEEHSATIATVQQPPAPDARDPNAGTENSVRSLSPHLSGPVVLSPQPGTTVHSDFMIRWEPIPNATAYEVRIVTAEGDLVWLKRVNGNSVSPPNQTLKSGTKYFVWVRALLPDGKTQQSAAVGFIGG